MTDLLHFIGEHLLLIYLLIFTVILGFEVISKVPTVLHTPLMSGANAISGVIIVGAILLIRRSDSGDYFSLALGTIAIALGMINVVGGFAAVSYTHLRAHETLR